jgi:hypothetical protein
MQDLNDQQATRVMIAKERLLVASAVRHNYASPFGPLNTNSHARSVSGACLRCLDLGATTKPPSIAASWRCSCGAVAPVTLPRARLCSKRRLGRVYSDPLRGVEKVTIDTGHKAIYIRCHATPMAHRAIFELQFGP